jgi:two-component system chemotaxis response regulator CheY
MKPARVLIVDDSSVMRKIVGRPLRQAGLELQEVLEASNGSEALTMAREHHLDLILSDIKMPMMAGLGFVRQLRGSEDDQHVPVVMITIEAGEALAVMRWPRGRRVAPKSPQGNTPKRLYRLACASCSAAS